MNKFLGRGITIFACFTLICCGSLSASGNTDMNVYDYLQTINVNIKKHEQLISFELPFIKPEGITTISTNEGWEVIKIHNIFVDAKIIKPKQSKVPMFMSGFFLFDTAYREPPAIGFEETSVDEESRNITMQWTLKTEKQKTYIMHENSSENWVKPRYYYVEYGKKEMLIEYDVYLNFDYETKDHKRIKIIINWIDE
jgi:hypothetical protein